MLEVNNLSMHFPVFKGLFKRQTGVIKAVDNISFSAAAGKTMGLVGESGCGKSTTGRAIIRLHQPTAGSIKLDGEDITHLRGEKLRHTRPKMQMIFQDPQSSLNPRMTVGSIVSEPLDEQNTLSNSAKRERINTLLNDVGLNPEAANRYPHEFSGGQRQRIGIARALALKPKLIVCDEPISALDVSIQAQIINLLEDLQAQHGFTYLFISHDLSVVRHIADTVAVMYLGKIVELATRDQIFNNPQHPYTQALLSAVPIANPTAEANRQRTLLHGDVPSSLNPPAGCHFSTRCPKATDLCQQSSPVWHEMTDGRKVACHLVDQAPDLSSLPTRVNTHRHTL